MLHCFLALNGEADVVKAFVVDELLQPIWFGESVDKPGAMLEDALR